MQQSLTDDPVVIARQAALIREMEESKLLQLTQQLMQVVNQAPPVYGQVEITLLAGKVTKVEKRETYKP